MEKKIKIILERARDGLEPLEDLERELLSLYNVRLLLPSDDEITEEMNKLPYTKHLDDGRYNDGVITGFEMGAEYVLKWCRSNKA